MWAGDFEVIIVLQWVCRGFEMGCLFGLKMANYLHGRELFLKFVTQNKVIP